MTKVQIALLICKAAAIFVFAWLVAPLFSAQPWKVDVAMFCFAFYGSVTVFKERSK